MYHGILELVEREFNLESLKRTSTQIYNFERHFCYKGFQKSALYFTQELKRAGALGVKKKDLPADGETTYLDHIMPQAFDVESATLEIVEPKEIPLKLLANHKEEPFCVANRCAPTPKEGITAEVISEEKMKKGEDVKGSIIFTQYFPPQAIEKEAIQKGSIGIISAYSAGYLDLPDGISWANGWSGGPGWYHTIEDKKIFCFCISPRNGDYLAKLLREKRVKVKAVVKSRIYNGSIAEVTGLIQGKEDREILFLAHLYEPLLEDDAIGGAALIEISRLLSNLIKEGKLPPLKRGIRFLASSERYGFAHFFADKRKREKIIAAVSLDAIGNDPKKTGFPVNIRMNPASQPFFGDFLLENMAKFYLSSYHCQIERGNFSDDTHMPDKTIGIPTNWVWVSPGKYHHNSMDAFDRIIDWNLAGKIITLVASYAYFLAVADKEKMNYLKNLALREAKIKILEESKKLMGEITKEKGEKFDFSCSWQRKRFLSLRKINPKEKIDDFEKEIEKIAKEEKSKIAEEALLSLTVKEKAAKNMIIERKSVGFPFSLAKVPFSQRVKKPKATDEVLNWADGKRNLYQIFKLVGYELRERLSQEEIRSLLRYFLLLDKYGYIKIHYNVRLSKKDIRNDLRNLGVKKGDRIMVHCSLSSIGYVEGGAETVCKALMESVGKEGVLMMPSFNHDAPFLKDVNGYYSPKETPTTNGIVPDTFWRMQSVYRSLNPTHAFAVWGNKAKRFVKNHHKVLTMGENSPLALLEKEGGKVILISAPGSNTFHHVVEMTNNVPCLGKRTEEHPVKLPSGKMVKCRTWGWRNGACPVTDKGAYLKIMKEKDLLKEGKIGNAQVLIFRMKDCRMVIEKFIEGKMKNFGGCKTCNIRPRVVSATVESDWDEKSKKVKEK